MYAQWRNMMHPQQCASQVKYFGTPSVTDLLVNDREGSLAILE
jgi:hypothetical protein